MMHYTRVRSQEVFEDARMVIPGGVNSPMRSFPGLPIHPIVAASGMGDIVIDIDGNPFVDYCGSWGAMILGHSHPGVVEILCEQVKKGCSFGMLTEIEWEIARLITKTVPSIEKIRFVSSGTEATMSAIRVARGYTKKNVIVKFDGHYHGHADSFLVRAGSGLSYLPETSSAGVPSEAVKHTISLPFNQIEECRNLLRYRDDIAAVILEPVAGNMGVIPAQPEFINMLREETLKKDIVLIFDEVITGFRLGPLGAQGYYGVRPDLTCFGKIIGGGMPAAAFGGRAEIMNCLAPLGPVYQAGTLSGNPVAMEAGFYVLQEILRPGFYDNLEQKTKLLTDPIEEAIRDLKLTACLKRMGSMFTLFFGARDIQQKIVLDDGAYRSLFLHLFEQGIYFSPSAYEACFVSAAHTEAHLMRTAQAVIDFLARYASETQKEQLLL